MPDREDQSSDQESWSDMVLPRSFEKRSTSQQNAAKGHKFMQNKAKMIEIAAESSKTARNRCRRSSIGDPQLRILN